MRITSPLPISRLDHLRGALLDSLSLLQRRRASDIPAGYIDDYVSLNWLEWYGGTLRLTVVGENVSKQQGVMASTATAK